MKIRVSYDYPPIPVRNMDYSAIDDSTYDGAPDAHCPVGHGATREEAIEELANAWDMHYDIDWEEIARQEQAARERCDEDTLLFIQKLRVLYNEG